jgi:hypothetical protein
MLGIEHHLKEIITLKESRVATEPQSRQSVRLSSGLAPPAPHPASESCPPSLWFQGGTHSVAGGGRGANSDEGTDTLVL